MTKVAIVILNWNGIKHLQQFLPSVVLNLESINSEVWVVDNGSTDNSVEFVKQEFPDVKLLCFDKNYGFTGGYNRALLSIKARYYVILNSDIEVTPNWLNPIIDFMDKEPNVAASAPKLLDWHSKDTFEYAGAAGGFIDHLGYPFCRGRIISKVEKDAGQYDKPISVFWATGAALVIRSEIFHSMGGFDDLFFAHMEEIDLCWRIKNAGYEIYNYPQSAVYHVGGGTLPNNNPHKIYLNYRNNLLLLYKNLPANRVFKVLFYRFFLDMASFGVFLLQGKFKFAGAVIRSYFDFMKMRKEYDIDRTNLKWHPEIYNKSIVFKFFLKKKHKFSDLNI
ncbi:MAG: glycosyltransferase family 2 protein [Salinivirgaceae bacterium]|nr:glycosyltransferase family 2 protein [Salinivirgaceae bacterium]MDD4747784.1 glycosyltransferase family 2 protein [Salinivirgaceae bacterium]MDY0280824.1 glycosyltransferase family 2 protein [Salinivirgaceae bacterium]